MNTQENNKLIAEFMGLVKSSYRNMYWTEKAKEGFGEGELVNLLYHTSWDWLMPVLEKIKNVGFAPDKMYNEKSIDYILTNNFSKTNLYHAVVEFIKSHNHIIERDKKRLG